MDLFDQKATGESALLHFLDLLANLDSFLEEYSFLDKQMKSPLMSFLRDVHNLNKPSEMPFPRTFGLVHRRDQEEINCKGFSIPNYYLEPFAKALRLSLMVTTIDLQLINLSEEACMTITKNLPVSIKHLNMSHNPLYGSKSMQALCSLVFDDKSEFQLETLQLENCGIDDTGLSHLNDHIEENLFLKFLNLGQNQIGHKKQIFQTFTEKLKQNLVLQILFLSWNKNIGPMGGLYIAELLIKNDTLLVLDISHCGLGPSIDRTPALNILQQEQEELNKKAMKEKDGVAPLSKAEQEAKAKKVKQDKLRREEQAKLRERMQPRKKAFRLDLLPWYKWKDALRINKTLIHLDISNNMLDAREVAVIKEGLDINHSILGIHFIGNEGDIDMFGNLKPHDLQGLKDEHDSAKSVLTRRIQPNLNMGTVTNKEAIKLQVNSNCWLCEGWTEYQFEFKPPEWIDYEVVPVKLHLSVDQYLGQIIEINEELSSKETEKYLEE